MTINRYFIRTLALLAVILLAAACQDEERVPSVELLNVAFTTDNQLAVAYPEGWAASPSGQTQILLTNSPALFGVSTRDLQTGQVIGNFTFLTRDYLQGIGVDEGEDQPQAVLDRIFGRREGRVTTTTTFDERDNFRADGRNALIAVGTGQTDDFVAAVIVGLIELDEGYGFLNLTTVEGEAAALKPVAEAILISAQVTRPVEATPEE